MNFKSRQNIYLLTEDRYLNPKINNEYNSNILLEDEILSEALSKEGIDSKRVIWSDPDIVWTNADYLLFRTTWDYFRRYSEFEKWLNVIKSKVPTINSLDTVLNNLDKRYLLDLQQKGIQIPQSQLLEIGDKVDFKMLLDKFKWEQAIVKPCISAAARETYVVNAENAEKLSLHISELLKKEAFLFQKFEEKVLTNGELSMMFFGGKYTHTILKKAKAGDFRVQDDFGGTVHPYKASKSEIAFGQKTLEALDEVPDYARVDVLWDSNGNPILSELELIEPELWFRFNPDSANVFAEHLKNKYF